MSCLRTSVSEDVTLYFHDRRSFFRLVGLASASQCVFWLYLAHFQYTKDKLLSNAVKGKEISVNRWVSSQGSKLGNNSVVFPPKNTKVD